MKTPKEERCLPLPCITAVVHSIAGYVSPSSQPRPDVPAKSALCISMQSCSTRIVRALLPRRQLRSSCRTCPITQRAFTRAAVLRVPLNSVKLPNNSDDTSPDSQYEVPRPEHAVISTFDLFSIGGEPFVTSSICRTSGLLALS